MTETTTTVAATTVTTKPEHKQISTYVGVAVAVIGNALPYVTPGLLIALHVPAPLAQTVCSIIGAGLVAYREKTKTSAVSSITTTT